MRGRWKEGDRQREQKDVRETEKEGKEQGRQREVEGTKCYMLNA